jgi:selenocysteine-specific elongation factor
MMYVVATAGHVDHGKSTLVRALTGMDPDRLAEERRRGLTIELGFAWTTLDGGATVAFVDVPGHERFISNMLAGVGPVPAVMFVVASDQGWSAQSREHLDALDALQVSSGILALTRSDLGDAGLAEQEAREYLAGTTLEDIEAVAVSAVTGAGLHQLRDALARLTTRMPDGADRRTRLWVDRVFSVRGAGTVVTGTLASGTVRIDEELQLHPSGELVRVRSIESLKQAARQVSATARVALNLRGVTPSRIQRGAALTVPGEWPAVSVIDVRVSPGGKLAAELVLHVGSAAIGVRVRPLGDDTARLTLARPIPTTIGDRGILRDPGTRRVVAAVVLDPLPPALHRRGAARRRAAALAQMSAEADVAAEVRRRRVVRRRDLVLIGAMSEAQPLPPEVVAAGGWLIDGAQWARWREQLPTILDEWAQRHPLRPGIPRQAVSDRLGVPDPEIIDALVLDSTGIVADGDGVHRRGQQARLPPETEAALEGLFARLEADPFDVPGAPELIAAGLTDTVLRVAAADERLIRIADGVYLRPAALELAVRALREIRQPFTMAEARQTLGTTRRVAVPLLERLDRARLTRRLDPQLREVMPSAPVGGGS